MYIADNQYAKPYCFIILQVTPFSKECFMVPGAKLMAGTVKGPTGEFQPTRRIPGSAGL